MSSRRSQFRPVTRRRSAPGPRPRSGSPSGRNPQGQVVAGSCERNHAHDLFYTVPVTLGLDQAAGGTTDRPFRLHRPGDQLESVGISVNRAPTVGISTSPEAILTGDSRLAQNRGSRPATSGPCRPRPASASRPGPSPVPTQIQLDQSRAWNNMVATYQHTATGGALSRQLRTSSGSPRYLRRHSLEPAQYSGHHPQRQHLARAGRGHPQLRLERHRSDQLHRLPRRGPVRDPRRTALFNPGQHQVVLTVTNTQNQETSVAVENVSVADGSVNPDFTWLPSSPQSTLLVSGVTGMSRRPGNFGGPGAPATTRPRSAPRACSTTCKSASYQLASGGSKTSSVTVRVGGQNFQATPKNDHQ